MVYLPTWSEFQRERLRGREEKSSVSSERLLGGPIAILPPILVSLECTSVHSRTYQLVLVPVHCMVLQASQPELAGEHSRKLAVFWHAGGST